MLCSDIDHGYEERSLEEILLVNSIALKLQEVLTAFINRSNMEENARVNWLQQMESIGEELRRHIQQHTAELMRWSKSDGVGSLSLAQESWRTTRHVLTILDNTIANFHPTIRSFKSFEMDVQKSLIHENKQNINGLKKEVDLSKPSTSMKSKIDIGLQNRREHFEELENLNNCDAGILIGNIEGGFTNNKLASLTTHIPSRTKLINLIEPINSRVEEKAEKLEESEHLQDETRQQITSLGDSLENEKPDEEAQKKCVNQSYLKKEVRKDKSLRKERVVYNIKPQKEVQVSNAKQDYDESGPIFDDYNYTKQQLSNSNSHKAEESSNRYVCKSKQQKEKNKFKNRKVKRTDDLDLINDGIIAY